MKTRDVSRILHPAKRMKTSIFHRTRGPQPITRFYTGFRRFGALVAFVAMIAATFYSASSASHSIKSLRRVSDSRSNSAATSMTLAGRKDGGLKINDVIAGMNRGNISPFKATSSFSALMPQEVLPPPPAETITVYASDCQTPRTSFVVGETICVRATNAPVSTPAERQFTWVGPDGFILQATDLTSTGQSDSFAMPNSPTFLIGGMSLNNLGTWTVNTIATSDASLRSVATFTVSDPVHPATDLSVAVNKVGASKAPSGGNVAFTMEVMNQGPDVAQSIELRNPVPAGTTFVSISPDSGPGLSCTTPGAGNTGTIVCSIASLSRDDKATFTVFYQVAEGTANDTVIMDTATVTSSVAELRDPDNAGADTTTVGPATCTVTCPSDIIVENADNAAGATVNFSIPTNACGNVTADPASGSFFPVGTTDVNVTSTTGGICTFHVTVNDTQVPTISCPSDITVAENPQTPGQAVVDYQVGVQDNEPGLTANCDRPSGTSFPVGDTTVTCTATDSTGNTSPACSFNVRVNGDNCALSCPEDIVVEAAANACGAIVTYAAQATECGTVTYSHASGSTFPVGTTTVTVSAPGRSCSFNVTVRDTTAPTLTVAVPPGVLTATVATTADASCVATIPDLRLHVTTSDNCATNVRIIQDPEAGSLVNAGTHTIIIYALDGDPLEPHNTSTASVTFTAQDVTSPTITLDGAPSITIECHTSFNDPGATAVDDCAGTFPATPSDTLDVDAPGTYTITYTASDAANNAGTPVTRTVIVVDTQAPTITLNGANTLTVECHTSFNDPGATATDSCADSFPATPSATVDVNTPGSYTITYTASDPSGNAGTPVTRTVNVVDTTAPVITLNGANPMTVECHTSFTDPGATASDSCASSVAVTPSGSVNVNVPGTYSITYNATDPAGNPAITVTRVVNVVDTIAPTITLNGQAITLWPPNHQYINITMSQLATSASDGCDSGVDVSDVVITKVTSDEAENSNGDGNTSNDMVIASNCRSVQLRSERSGNGNGRVYTIHLRVQDASGNTTTVTKQVKVPKNQGNNGGAVDNGPQYTVTSNCP